MKVKWRKKGTEPISRTNLRNGDIVLAIRDCIMKSGPQEGKRVITKGTPYVVLTVNGSTGEFKVIDDKEQEHFFNVRDEKEPFFVKYVGLFEGKGLHSGRTGLFRGRGT